ncbi:MAG: exodeoxyribonuclease VII large subunit [Acidobacteriota bacterium]
MAELTGEVKELLNESFYGLWVKGEVQRPRESQRGHLYFELVEKGRGDQIIAKLDAVIWRTDHQRIRRQLSQAGVRLADAQEIRCRAEVDFYPPSGRLQLIVRDVDASFALGGLEQRRRETLRALEAADLLDRNAELSIGLPPMRLGLVTSDGSAAQRDVLASLGGSGFGFEVLFVHAAVQGRSAETEIAGALELLGDVRPGGHPLDAVLLVRGGGARTDLAAFDSRSVAFAVARSPLPVVCGLGHEIDRTLADRVAHTSVTTPTKAAELMVESVARIEQRLVEVRRALGRAAEHGLQSATLALSRSERLARRAQRSLAGHRRRVDAAAAKLEAAAGNRIARLSLPVERLAERLTAAAERSLERRRRALDPFAPALLRGATQHLDARTAELDATARLLRELDPARLLERGFSLTYGDDGRLIQAPDQVRSGEMITSRLRGGELSSRVEKS